MSPIRQSKDNQAALKSLHCIEHRDTEGRTEVETVSGSESKSGSTRILTEKVKGKRDTSFSVGIHLERLRVADAIARLAAHETGHAVGLVAQSAELSSDALAVKLMVNGLLSGSSSHHNPSSGSGVNIMFATNSISDSRAWNVALYDFSQNEKTCLDRILP